MRIRLLKREDIPKARGIVWMNYNTDYSQRAGRELLDMFGEGAIRPTYLVAEENHKVLGFAGFIQAWMDYDIYEIFWVNVVPDQQGRGIGKALVKRVIREIKKNANARMIILTAHEASRLPRYYWRFGFSALCEFGNGYHLMHLKL